MKNLTLNNTAPYQQLYERLKTNIRQGRLQGKLPSIAELTHDFAVSHCTIKKVLDRLKEQNYIYGMQGKGVYVNESASSNPAFQKNIVFYLHIETYRNPFYLHVVSILRKLLESEKSIVHFVNSPQQLAATAENTDVLLIVGISNKLEAAELEAMVGKEKILQLNENCGDYRIVATDNFCGGYMAVEYLYQRGHRKIGLISRDLGMDCFFLNRYQGAMQYAAEHPDIHIFNSEITISPTNADEQTARIATEKLLQQHPDVTAIFAFTDILAMGVMAFCQANGIDIPDRVSLIGFDNRDFAPMLSPPLTTFKEDTANLAKQALTQIYRIIEGNHKTEVIKVKSFLVERASVRTL